MTPETLKQVTSMGGRTAHEKGTLHKFTSEETRKGGRKGGATVSKDREHMAELGRKGGSKPKSNRR